MKRRPPMRDDAWFQQKIRELADALRELPRDRQDAFVDALDADEGQCSNLGGKKH